MIRIITYCIVSLLYYSTAKCQYNLVLQTPNSIVDFHLPSKGLDSILVFQSDKITMNQLGSSSYSTLFDSIITSYTKLSDSSLIFIGEQFNSRKKLIGISYNLGGSWVSIDIPFRPANSIYFENNLIHLINESNFLLSSPDLIAYDTIGRVANNGSVISFEHATEKDIYASLVTSNSNILRHSDDGGVNWQTLQTSSRNTYLQKIQRLNSGVAVLKAPNQFDIYKPNRILFSSISLSPAHYISRISDDSDGVIFCAGAKEISNDLVGFLYYSKDDGENWTDISPQDNTAPIITFKLDADTIYLSNDFKQILKSDKKFDEFGVPLFQTPESDTMVASYLKLYWQKGVTHINVPISLSNGVISIYNVQGARQFSTYYRKNGSVVTLPTLASGIYYFSIIDKSGTAYTDKFTIFH